MPAGLFQPPGPRPSWRVIGAPTWRPASNGSGQTVVCSRAISPWKRWGSAGRRCGTRLSESRQARPLRRSWPCSAARRDECIAWTDASRGPDFMAEHGINSTKQMSTVRGGDMAEQPWLPAAWDGHADVVVVGFGAAGAATAITVYDA